MSHPAHDSDSLLALFHHAFHLVFHQLHRQGSHAQGRVLGLLAEHGPLSQKALLESLPVRAASLSELLGKLEKNGAITRERDRLDKRSVVVSLTEEGRRAAAASRREMENGLMRLFDPLDDAEKARLLTLLTKLVNAWEAGVERDGPDRPQWGDRRGRHHDLGRKGREEGEEDHDGRD